MLLGQTSDHLFHCLIFRGPKYLDVKTHADVFPSNAAAEGIDMHGLSRSAPDSVGTNPQVSSQPLPLRCESSPVTCQ